MGGQPVACCYVALPKSRTIGVLLIALSYAFFFISSFAVIRGRIDVSHPLALAFALAI
jgi:hypothetical protein